MDFNLGVAAHIAKTARNLAEVLDMAARGIERLLIERKGQPARVRFDGGRALAFKRHGGELRLVIELPTCVGPFTNASPGDRVEAAEHLAALVEASLGKPL